MCLWKTKITRLLTIWFHDGGNSSSNNQWLPLLILVILLRTAFGVNWRCSCEVQLEFYILFLILWKIRFKALSFYLSWEDYQILLKFMSFQKMYIFEQFPWQTVYSSYDSMILRSCYFYHNSFLDFVFGFTKNLIWLSWFYFWFFNLLNIFSICYYM